MGEDNARVYWHYNSLMTFSDMGKKFSPQAKHSLWFPGIFTFMVSWKISPWKNKTNYELGSLPLSRTVRYKLGELSPQMLNFQVTWFCSILYTHVEAQNNNTYDYFNMDIIKIVLFEQLSKDQLLTVCAYVQAKESQIFTHQT